MLIDVERRPHGKLYGLSQGQWDGVGEGSRAFPDTGRLLVVGRHGNLTPVDRRGRELVLDRPRRWSSSEPPRTSSRSPETSRVDGL